MVLSQRFFHNQFFYKILLKVLMAKKSMYKVSHILDRKEQFNQKTRTNNVFYLVAWEGYSEDQATWEPIQNLSLSKQLKREMRQFDGLYNSKTPKNETKRKLIQKSKKTQSSSYNIDSESAQQEKKIDNTISNWELRKKNVKSKNQKEKQTNTTHNPSFQKNQKARLQKFKNGFFIKKEKPSLSTTKQIIFQKLNNKIDTIFAKKNHSGKPAPQVEKDPREPEKRTQIIKIEEPIQEERKQEEPIPINISQSQSDDDFLMKQGEIEDLNSQIKIKGMLKLKDSFVYLVQQKGKSRLVKRKDMLVSYPYELICFYETRINIEPAELDSLVQKHSQIPLLGKPKSQEEARRAK